VFIEDDARWTTFVDDSGARPSLVRVDHVGLADTMRALAFEPRSLDLVVTAKPVAPALEELAAGTDGDDRLVAVARLAGEGPSLFAPARCPAPDDAGQGVADPSSMLLAASLLLREGLREEHAAETLWAALRHARVNGSRPAAMRRTLAATTRDFGDAVVSLLPASHRNAEFVPETAA
jgi:isocitrate/isopropylmalate dehydrogenase